MRSNNQLRLPSISDIEASDFGSSNHLISGDSKRASVILPPEIQYRESIPGRQSLARSSIITPTSSSEHKLSARESIFSKRLDTPVIVEDKLLDIPAIAEETSLQTKFFNKGFEGHTYNLPDSNRLTNRLVNKYNKGIRAEIGSYNPYQNMWGAVKKKEVWSKSERFMQEANANPKLGPGMYNPIYIQHSIIQTAQVSFKSTAARFERKKEDINEETIERPEVCIFLICSYLLIGAGKKFHGSER